MNPADALTADYGMYYDGCYMRHRNHGIGRIQVIGGDLYLCTSPNADPKLVKPSYLECWWPRAGAFNTKTHAVYIARRAVRNMRKSAVGNDHYFVKWGTPYGVDVMTILQQGTNEIRMDKAIELLNNGSMSSVAVSRDIIISPEEGDTYSVTFRGMECGTWSNGGFTPLFSESPLTARVLRQLEGRT